MKKIRLYALFIILLTFNLSNLLKATEITINVTDIENKPISDLVVYLLPLENQSLENIKMTPLVISQSQKKFKPYISVIQKGLPLTFNNVDDITHHIYSASASNRFSFRIKSGNQKSIKPLKNTGKVLMGCNIHDWMGGYLLILDTPLYTKTNKEGKAKVKVTVTGEYQLSVWHPQLMAENQTITTKINIKNRNIFKIKLANKMADIPNQVNPESTDFTDDY